MGDFGAMCPVFRPTREEFEQPFCDYVRKVFKKNPDLPMFKVGGRALRPGAQPLSGVWGTGPSCGSADAGSCHQT